MNLHELRILSLLHGKRKQISSRSFNMLEEGILSGQEINIFAPFLRPEVSGILIVNVILTGSLQTLQ